MEAKLHALSNSSEIYEKYGELKSRYRSLREENTGLKARIQQCADEESAQSHEITTLQVRQKERDAGAFSTNHCHD